MRRPRCDADTPDATKFRIECGLPLRLRCLQCGADTPPRAKCRGACGTPLMARNLATPPALPPSLLSETPDHLAEKSLTSKAAFGGERKQ
jgi:hypothetical protein